ncbi:MAG TPA: O-antigen ligase domain-containing protein, partial [Gammaproteobacteria bacterium]|nr:O-antigen ligase domain-containing protein [Gammaproteobacteria bacterium]
VVIRAWLEVHGYVDDLAWSSFGPGRANGTMHPIRFGDLVLLLGFLSLAGSLYIRDVKSWMRAVGVLAFFCGLYASLLSQSRGGWIAIPALLAIVLWPVFRDLQLKNKFVLVLAIIIGVTIMFNMPGLKTKQRIDQAVIDIDQYWQHGNSKTSIGSRFDMYETAYALFLQKPLFGVGVGNYRENSANYFESNKDRMSREVIIWDNPHNEILLQMATRGLVGLVVLVMLFLSGIIIFFTHLRQYDRDTLFYAVSGLMVLVAYMHFGMSIALFKHRDFILFFVIYILLFSAGVHKGAVLSEKTL